MYFRGQRKSASDVSLSECIETGRDGNALSLMDVICSEEDLFEDLSTRELHGQLRAVMEQILTPREKAIVSLRYGLSGGAPLTQREIAEQCGISRSYVSRIEKKALRIFRRQPHSEKGQLPAPLLKAAGSLRGNGFYTRAGR